MIVTYQAYEGVFNRLKEFFRAPAECHRSADERPHIVRHCTPEDLAVKDAAALVSPDFFGRVEPWDFLAG
ncbi:hypothetical protein ACFQU1_04495 [Chelatococcus sp. GCM10030263]|uniref:hypothetical protein n=1 Tax=Chelatococcus sp. GCM10030263 TaxID=3273387 RepID=UPI00360A279B